MFDKLVEETIAGYDRIIGLDLSEVAVDGSLHKAGGGEGTEEVVDGNLPATVGARGLKEGWIALVPVTLDYPNKADALKKVAEWQAKIVAGELKVPSNLAELEKFTPP